MLAFRTSQCSEKDIVAMADKPNATPEIVAARQLIRQGNTAGAIEQLQKLLELDDANKAALELLGVAYFRQRSFEEAQKAFEKLTRLDPMNSGAWVNLGAVQNVLKEFQKATNALRKAIQRDRKSASAYFNLGIAQKGLKMPKMAVSAYQEALKLKPTMTDATVNLGNLYIEMKNFRQAVKVLEDGLQHDPKAAKLQRILQKAKEEQKGIRQEAAPFGRLVDEKELARKQKRLARRELSTLERNQEREDVQEATKEIRHHVRRLVPLIDAALQDNLHILHLSAAQHDSRGEAPNAFDNMLQVMKALGEHRNAIEKSMTAIRQHAEPA